MCIVYCPLTNSIQIISETASPWPGPLHSFLQRASSCYQAPCMAFCHLSFLRSHRWARPGSFGNLTIPGLVLLILGTWCFPRSFLDFKVTLPFFFPSSSSFALETYKHDCTLPVPAGSSFCSSGLPALAGSTPAHLWGCLGPFPGQLD